mmetsp:Transcript_137108/g.341767  ORF Transcript_137108/g.341767 Transcript_137108/m.341767 type:complete len:262 (-) Transcript_137108:204-989(-)
MINLRPQGFRITRSEVTRRSLAQTPRATGDLTHELATAPASIAPEHIQPHRPKCGGPPAGRCCSAWSTRGGIGTNAATAAALRAAHLGCKVINSGSTPTVLTTCCHAPPKVETALLWWRWRRQQRRRRHDRLRGWLWQRQGVAAGGRTLTHRFLLQCHRSCNSRCKRILSIAASIGSSLGRTGLTPAAGRDSPTLHGMHDLVVLECLSSGESSCSPETSQEAIRARHHRVLPTFSQHHACRGLLWFAGASDEVGDLSNIQP